MNKNYRAEWHRRHKLEQNVRCLDCNKLINFRSIRCLSCAARKRQIGTKQTLATRDKIRLSQLGHKGSGWKGGIISHPDGYLMIYQPEHPYSNKQGYVMAHRLEAEKYLYLIDGRKYLTPQEVVHHIDGYPDHNDIINLRIFPSNYEHLIFHQKILKEK